jgi:GNAT superfamily N-acetyltransferase
MLTDGYHSIPPGALAAVVTSLAMTARPPLRAEIAEAPWTLERLESPEPEAYRRLYRAVGEAWLWFSRLRMDDAALSAIIQSPEVEVYHLRGRGDEEGLLELDFREAGACELAFFGLSPSLVGGQAGRWLMNRAIERAWSRPIETFWVHTCTFDHPAALSFYQRSGFAAFKQQVEVFADPRKAGLADPKSAPHVPSF